MARKTNVLEYKGYFTKVEYDAEDGILYGKIEGINDLVNFESHSMKSVEKEFHRAVDSPALHKKLSAIAGKNGDTLNASVEKAIQQYVIAEEGTPYTVSSK